MAEQTKSIQIFFRVNEEEQELLFNEAKKRNLSNGQTAKVVVLEAISGFDQKQESFLRRFDKLDDLIELLISIASLGAGAAALPFEDDNQDVGELREKLKIHIKQSRDLGRNIVDMIKKGKL
jgi:hypothetical protein